MTKKKLEVCLTPANFSSFNNKNSVVIIVDIFRASSAICNAFHNGIDSIIPVSTVKEARILKNQGYLLAAERDGKVLDFADFGNSPFNFKRSAVANKIVAYSTTNGTKAMLLAKDNHRVFIGSFLNLTALYNKIIDENRDLIILCSGWKNRFNIEDTLFAGALAERLINSGKYISNCDSVLCSLELWNIAKNNIIDYINKAASKSRMIKLGIDDSIEFCLTIDVTDKVAEYKNGRIISA